VGPEEVAMSWTEWLGSVINANALAILACALLLVVSAVIFWRAK
jgi:hypothetical protein